MANDKCLWGRPWAVAAGDGGIAVFLTERYIFFSLFLSHKLYLLVACTDFELENLFKLIFKNED